MLTGALLIAAVLMLVASCLPSYACRFKVALSAQFLSPVRALLARDLSTFCELPAPGRHTSTRAVRSIDKGVAASAEFGRAPIPVPVQAVQVFRRERGKGTGIVFRRYRFPRTRAPDSSGRDSSECAVWPPTARQCADQRSRRRWDRRCCTPVPDPFPAADCTTRTW